MILGGMFVRWAQDGGLRARIAGQWCGVLLGSVATLALADRMYVVRASRTGAIGFMHDEERTRSAEDCIEGNGHVARQEERCISDGRGGKDCDSVVVEVSCSVVDAHRDLAAIYRARVRTAAHSDPLVLADERALLDVSADCWRASAADSYESPLSPAVCEKFLSSRVDDIAVRTRCVSECSEAVELSWVSVCARQCTVDHLPWVEDWAFNYVSSGPAEASPATSDAGS